MRIVVQVSVLLLLVAPRVAAQRTSILAADCRTPRATPAAPPLAWRGETIQVAEWPVSLGPRRIAMKIVVTQFDPRAVQLSLDIVRDGDAIGNWLVSGVAPDVIAALNAGQFNDDGPWGWVVHRGKEWQEPGTGPLSGAFIVDSTGKVDVIGAASVTRARKSGRIVEAVQSYPMLLAEDGMFPNQLCTDSGQINLEHRDTRLAIGVRADGKVVVALTRYDGAGAVGARLPVGPTTPEMAEVMKRLGATRAVMLDGGLSAQLLVRNAGVTQAWLGLRSVPLGLVVRHR